MTDHRNRQPAGSTSPGGSASPRVPRGVPTGGQFAASAHAEAALNLDPADASEAEMGALMDAHNAEHGYYDPGTPTGSSYVDGVRARGCRCDFNPGTTEGPEIDCPVHGAVEYRTLALGDGHTLTLAGDPETVIAHLPGTDGTPGGEYLVEYPGSRVHFTYGEHRGQEEAAFAAADAAKRLVDLARQEAATETDAYERNRTRAEQVLAAHDAGSADPWEMNQAVLAVEATLARSDSPAAQAARDLLRDSRSDKSRSARWNFGSSSDTPSTEDVDRMAEALRDALATGDRTIRTHDGKTAEQWRAEAAGSRRRSADSFARSDTDGFLSQWASDTMARRYDACATLAEQGGKADFPALLDEHGNLVPAKIIDTQYGRAFALLDPANPEGKFKGFVNLSNASTAAKRNAHYSKKGYRLGQVRVPATVRMSDGLQPSPYFARTDGGFDPRAEIVATEETDE